MYRIEMWSFAVGATAGAARHNFLVLVDSNGNAVKELHGGAREVVDGASQHKPSRLLVDLRRFSLLAGLALATAVAGCGGPPALTSTTDEGGVSAGSRYFGNVISTQEPRDMERVANFIEKIIVERGDNQSDTLERLVIQSGGHCNTSPKQISCQIDRRVIVNECFRGNCARRAKQWIVFINWPNQTGPIQPRVRINMTTQQLSN